MDATGRETECDPTVCDRIYMHMVYILACIELHGTESKEMRLPLMTLFLGLCHSLCVRRAPLRQRTSSFLCFFHALVPRTVKSTL